MADTIVMVAIPSGYSSPVIKLSDVSTPDTIVNNSPNGDTLTELTNMKGFYTATISESVTGLHLVTVETSDGSVVLRTGEVSLADDLNTYRVQESCYIMSGTKEGELSISSGVAQADMAQISGDATAANNLEAMFDGNGYTDGEAPATQDQLAALLSDVMTEEYATVTSAVSVRQALYMILQRLTEFGISGTTITVNKRDQVTPAFTLTLNDASQATSSTQAT